MRQKEKEIIPASLSGGENQLELHLGRLELTTDATSLMGTAEPSIFFTLEFFDFQIQFTPAVLGPSADVNYSSFYVVSVSDLFLHCLQTDGLWLEMHEARGSRYRTWGGATIIMSSILNSESGKIAGSLQIVGLPNSMAPGVTLGNLQFSVSFEIPLEESRDAYKERIKALGYLGDLDSSGQAQDEDLSAAHCLRPSL